VQQWVDVAKETGMSALILTAKHHDGFCLWPSEYTDHDIANAPYKNGGGDVVGELAAACRDAGIGFGVYLSPWDRNHPEYGRPEYVNYFRNQLEELLTNYGPVVEVWFDGANGGDGYYGGAREERRIDRTTYYGWEDTWAIVRDLQPGAVLFSDVGPDIRWVGNERGYAGDPCWATFTPQSVASGVPAAPGLTRYKEAQNGHIFGQQWMPAEVDVSIRPGWFYHEKENRKVRSADNLMQIYYESVGRGAGLLLNIPPDRRGHFHEKDVAALRAFKQQRDAIFEVDLAQSATAEADNVRGQSETFAAASANDGDRATYWAADTDVTGANVTLTFDSATRFDHVVLQEYIELGQRITAFQIEARVEGEWKSVADGTSIGWKRILHFDPVSADAVRIVITGAKACPTLSTFAVFASPE
jgi:alpha-L-fucosidase